MKIQAEPDLPISQHQVSYFKGALASASLSSNVESWDETIAPLRKDIADAMNSKHLSFLLGSGASSARTEDGKELGIPTMAPMAAAFYGDTSGDGLTGDERSSLSETIGIDLTPSEYGANLELLMETLYGARFILERSVNSDARESLKVVDGIIKKVTNCIKRMCTMGEFARGDGTVLSTYTQFYRRLIQRDRALPRPWVFTTNYDLFNETAMDRAGIPYINGFLGSIERRFNPAVFRYALSEQLDLASRKWSSVDSLVYFCKLHGSISWESRGDGLFPVVETHPDLITSDQLLIYPTPAKQNASFASPYSDMFREFQTRVAREQSVLIILGYGFGDQHVNNIIFQALTIPTFRLVVFADPGNAVVRRLRELRDPRVWIIGTEDGSADWKGHYFSNFVEQFMASEGDDPADLAIERVLEDLLMRGTVRAGDNDDE